MHRTVIVAAAALLVAASVAQAAAHRTAAPLTVAAAGAQGFFAGYWRCSTGSLNVTPEFGPWLTYRSQSGGGVGQSFVYNDAIGRGWVNVGVDSAGGYWSMTSGGWQGNTLTYTGSYTNQGRSQSQRQVFTRLSMSRFTVQTFRNGAVVGQNSCSK
jgi:hypothetical protein